MKAIDQENDLFVTAQKEVRRPMGGTMLDVIAMRQHYCLLILPLCSTKTVFPQNSKFG